MKPGDRGYKRSWKNLLINKRYQLRFTLFMVGLSALLMVGLGAWVMWVADETTAVSITSLRGDACPKLPAVSSTSDGADDELALPAPSMKLDDPDQPATGGAARADGAAGSAAALAADHEPRDATRGGVNRPAVPDEPPGGGNPSPLWIDEPRDATSGETLPGEPDQESTLWILEPDAASRTDLRPSTAPTDTKMGWESQWPPRSGTSPRANVIAVAIAVPLIVSIGIGIWWFARTDALPARGIQVKPVAEIPPIEEVTKLALPAPVPDPPAESVPAHGPNAQAAASAHSSETATGGSVTRSALPAEELPSLGSGPSPPAAARPWAGSSAPVVPGSAARTPPAAPSAEAPTAAAAPLPVVPAAPGAGDAAPVLLPHAAIDRVASQHARELSTCNAGQGLHGEITVWFSVNPAGKVSKAQVATTLRKPSVSACILRSVQAWQFPPQADPGAVGTYTLSFQ